MRSILRLRNRKIGTRITGLVVITLTSTAILLTLVFSRTSSLSDKFAVIVDEVLPLTDVISDIATLHGERAAHLGRVIARRGTLDRELLPKQRLEFNRLSDLVEADIQSGLDIIDSWSDEASSMTRAGSLQNADFALRGIEKENAEYRFKVERLLNLLARNRFEKAELATDRVEKESKQLRAALGVLSHEAKAFGAQTSASANRARQRTRNSLLVATTILFAISFGLGILTTRTIYQPLQAATDVARQIAKGNLNPHIPKIDAASKDEVATLLEAMRHMAEELERTTVSRDLAESILDAMSDVLVVLNPDGTIRSANSALTSALGYREGEIVGWSFAAILEDEDGDQDDGEEEPTLRVAPLRKLVREGVLRDFSIVFCAKDRTPVSMALNGSVMRSAEGEIEAIVCVARDMRETHKRLAAEAVSDAERARALELTEAYTELEATHKRLQQLQGQLVEVSRRAGMSEIATGVLHNVGNVVNSVNISAALAQDGLQNTSLGILESVIALLEAHGSDPASLQSFLGEDSRGKRMVESLEAIAQRLRQEHSNIDGELASLRDHVSHIIAIVASQQEFARSIGVLEEVELRPFLDSAIALCGTAFSSQHIRVECSYGEVPVLTIEPHKLMQILVNLLSNARHALAANDPGDRVVQIQAELAGDDSVVISVTDNGSGIPKEHLTRIFTHGFTTKTDGHGFGLHISATAAIELGGKLTAKSEGPGMGATFLVTLPTRSARTADARGTKQQSSHHRRQLQHP